MHQSIPAAPIPPLGNCGAFARIVSPGGQALAYPRATPGFWHTRGFWLKIQMWTILSEKTSGLSLIGLSVKDWTKLGRFLKVCFLDFRHFRNVYQATTWVITFIHWSVTRKDRCDYVFRVQNVCDDIPGVWHLPSSSVPTPGNLPPKTKKY